MNIGGTMASPIGVCWEAEGIGEGHNKYYLDLVTEHGQSHSKQHLILNGGASLGRY